MDNVDGQHYNVSRLKRRAMGLAMLGRILELKL